MATVLIKFLSLFLLVFLLAETPPELSEPFCHWGSAVEAGILDAQVSEASGMAISARYPDRLYHINDSGDTGRFLVTDLKGANARPVSVEGFEPSDIEDLAIGPCGAPAECLFLADIGDNGRRRPEVTVVVVEERAEFPVSVPAFARIRMRYPDGPHDAESLAVHPDGTLFILTKEYQGMPTSARSAGPVQLFKLPPDRWKKKDAEQPLVLEPVITIDFTQFILNAPVSARIPTAMDISRDGKRVIILLYADAFELAIDLSKPIPQPASWREGKEFQRIKLANLPQQEGAAFAPDGRAFLYETERQTTRGAGPARLMRVACTP